MADAGSQAIGAVRLSWPTRLAWTVCAMPELLKSFVWDAFILFYYTQVVGLHGGLIGLALIIILIFDAVADPYIGALSDRLVRAPLGRRHTLMAAAILPFMIGVAAVFAPPGELSQWQTFAWLIGFGLLARVGISFWTVPAYALGGELSRDPRERSLIAVLRNLGNQLIILTVPAVAFGWFFVATPGFARPQLNPAPYPGFGLFASLLGGALMIIGLVGTLKRARQIDAGERPAGEPEAAKGPIQILRDLALAVRQTPNIGRLLVIALLVLFVSSTINQLSLHLATYFWQLDPHDTQRLLMAGVVGTMASFLVAPRWLRLAGTRWAMILGLLAYFLLQAAAVMLPLVGLSPSPGTTAIGTFVVVFRFLGGFAYGLYVVPFNTVTYDIGDEHEANTGIPQQGLVASFMFLGLQAGSGLVGLTAGMFFGLIDFPVGLPVEQMPQDKIDALAIFVISLILVAGTAMAFLVGGFKVSAEKQAAVRARLAALRAQPAAE
jgi:glycoside/pentoside/hexuronide:cation symporter, GPH family